VKSSLTSIINSAKFLEEMEKRKSEYDISPIILDRQSLRAMSGEEMKEDEFMPLFEAARWAPSSYNNQHWRFIYAKRNTEYWSGFFNLLGEFNRKWCKDAALLVVAVSKKTLDINRKPARTHSFDAGAAWENLALEGTRRGFIVHAMEGFDYSKARELLKLSDEYQVEAMIAIGKPGKKEEIEKHETSGRKPLNDMVFEGKMKSWQ
jgi:nitroreductase